MRIPSARPAAAEDLPFLVGLRLQTIDEHIRRAGTVLSLQEHQARAASRLECCTIFELDETPIGMIKVVRAERVWDVEQFQLSPQNQGRGMGTEIVRALQREAASAGAILTLGVLATNPALRLYERLGFRRVSQDHDTFYMQSAP